MKLYVDSEVVVKSLKSSVEVCCCWRKTGVENLVTSCERLRDDSSEGVSLPSRSQLLYGYLS